MENDPRFIGARFSHVASDDIVVQAGAPSNRRFQPKGNAPLKDQRIINSDNIVYGPGSSTFPTKKYSLLLV
jgi:hypothetical protein